MNGQRLPGAPRVEIPEVRADPHGRGAAEGAEGGPREALVADLVPLALVAAAAGALVADLTS